MPATMASWPTLAELRNADYSYLGQLAGYLEKISPQAQTALQDLAEDVKRPGGVDWEGEAGDAAIAQAEADLVKARPVMWAWDDVAASARRWQDELEAGTRTALDAVEDAERDGFTVNQDYSVSDTRQSATAAEFAQRVAAAEAHANYIRHHVGTLVGNESRINGELKAMTASWGTLTFPQSGGGVTAQPVDRTFKQGPDQPGTGPYDPNPDYPGRNNLGQYGGGNTGSADGAAAAEKALQDYEQKYHTTLIRQQIRVSVVDPQTGQPIYRYYDALEPIPGQPGKYIGIEVKSGTASLSPNQRIFDAQVSPQNPAAGTLNGQPVKITDTDVLRAPRFVPEPPAAGEPGAASGAPPVKPPPVEPPAAPKPAPEPAPGKLPLFGGPGAGLGPHVAPPPHAHPHWLGETPEEEWEDPLP